ncbi:MAG: hypothetical protein JW995_08290 [Melioribacteraceae bacterium]|nr:hypothetical protein [Melioribacteraceae bacterium]
MIETRNTNFNEVRYFTATILNIERNKITLSNGTEWNTDRLFIGVNLSEIIVVLDEIIDEGYFYFKDSKIGIRRVSEVFFGYSTGYLHNIKTLHNQGAVMELIDGSLWFVPLQNREMVNSWLTRTEVIITEDQKRIINPAKFEFIYTERLYTDLQKNQ